MVFQKKSKEKSRPSLGQVSRSQSAKPPITLEPKPPSLLDADVERQKALRQLNLKTSDILSERETDSELILVTKNGMKVRVKK